MNKNKIVYLFILIFLIMAPIYAFFSKNNSEIDTNKSIAIVNTSEKDFRPNNAVSLYDMYYRLRIKKLLKLTVVEQETSTILSEIKANLENTLENNSKIISIHDIWLYTGTTNLTNGKLLDRELVTKLLNEHKNSSGLFTIQSSIKGDVESEVSLVSTIMACEILYNYEDECIISVDSVLNIYENMHLYLNELDLISFGDNVVMINSILEKYTSSEDASYQIAELNNKYCSILQYRFGQLSQLSLLEYLTLKDLAKICLIEKEIFNDMNNLIINLQLEDGTFPIYGKNGEDSDLLTTYFVLELLEYFHLEIPNKQKLISIIGNI
ncbi:hypothetical protein [Lysinibacillus sphaericus]|uniref:hypothetical protein n=1 Tax=Lysinibacillus sphaericus TaxID=1421 RepID=UPI000567D8D1|nr:hypothetical protein [Lysinibacillus sphaericus]